MLRLQILVHFDSAMYLIIQVELIIFKSGAKNANGGDIIRIIVKKSSNNDPVARNDVGHVAEDGTLQVDNGDNANVSGSYDAAGEHSGDVLQTSSGTHQDTDADSDTLVVTAIRTGSVEEVEHLVHFRSALTGSYGQLTTCSKWFLYICS